MGAWSQLRRVASRARRATAAELGFATRAWILAPLVEVGLARLGLRSVLRLLGRLPRGRPRPSDRRVDVRSAAAWVDRAYAVHLVRGRCLPRAIVQLALHRLDGTPSRLLIGVRPGASETIGLEAHAWVEPAEDTAATGFVTILDMDGGLADARPFVRRR